MDQNPNNLTGETTRIEGAAGRVAAPPESASPQSGYVPPEVRPAGEPTRQFTPPPNYQNVPYQVPHAPRRHGTPIVLPTLLIGAGIVFLLQNLGVLPEGIWYQIWRLWPLLLIAIGLDLLVGRRNPLISVLIVLAVLVGGAAFIYSTTGFNWSNEVLTREISVPLGGARSAEVTIESGVGQFTLDGDESTLLASGVFRYPERWSEPQQNVSSSGDTIKLNLKQSGEENGGTFIWNGPSQGAGWDVHLNDRVPTRLTVDSGVGETTLDLQEIDLTELTLRAGTGTIDVTMPETTGLGTTRANIQGGVGSLDISIPESVEARIEVDSGLGAVEVDDRFRKEGDNVYISDGYNSARDKLDMEVHVGIGAVNINSR
jgi:hypothetical protein